MTGPVILGRAGRKPLKGCTPANHPVSGLPLSYASPQLRDLAALLSTGQLVNRSTDQGLTGCVQAISTSPPTGELCMGLVEVMRART